MKQPTTASVAVSNKKLAEMKLAQLVKANTLPEKTQILSIADHGDHIMCYTDRASFSVRKNNGSTSKTR